jgi:hypothetical protein
LKTPLSSLQLIGARWIDRFRARRLDILSFWISKIEPAMFDDGDPNSLSLPAKMYLQHRRVMHLSIAFATAFDTCSFMDNPESSVTRRISTRGFGLIILLPNTNWFDGPRSGCSCRTKRIEAVLSALKNAPLSRAHFSVLGSSCVCSLEWVFLQHLALPLICCNRR